MTSTPLGLRGDPAAIIAATAGVGKEIFVDTDNWRLSLQDGATAGGHPIAMMGDVAGRNAIINGNFAINQRGYASGASLAGGAFGHDRWKAGSGGCAYTFSQGATDTVAAITAGTLVQAVDMPNVYGASMWLTWVGTAQARVWQGSASGSLSGGTSKIVGGVAVNALLVTGLTLGTIAAVEFSTGTLGLVQLEAALPNAGPTRFERRHTSTELAMCQRYFQRWQQPPLRGVLGNGVAQRMGMTIPQMRAAPTVSMNGNLPLFNGASTTTALSIANIYATANALEVDLNLTSTTGYTNLQSVVVYQSGTSFLDINAEI